MLIQNAEILAIENGRVTTRYVAIRIEDSLVSAVGEIPRDDSEPVLDARHNLVLPGINDHHIHFLSYAAALGSVRCGPPDVASPAALRDVLASAPDEDWIRGVGYHASMGIDLDRSWLDRHGPERPIRIQHRTGRLWIFNSLAIEHLTRIEGALPGLDLSTGRLFDQDETLRDVIPADLSMVKDASEQLLQLGITGFNDMTPSNNAETHRLFEQLQREGRIRQSITLSGSESLTACHFTGPLTLGATKLHLHEANLPPFDDTVEQIRQSHGTDRPVAIHCVTETELVFALAALRESGSMPRDRIEHASVANDELIDQIRALGVGVVTQPGFIRERGDAYLQDVAKEDLQHLYRTRSLIEAGIPVAFSSDAPFTEPNPWLAMAAAVDRNSPAGVTIGADECVTPEVALAAYLGSLESPFLPRTITVGTPASLILLDRDWFTARESLGHVNVQATIADGTLAFAASETT